MDTTCFLLMGAGVVALALYFGLKLLRIFEFDRVNMWAAIADWASANEAAARYRVEIRRLKPWRGWSAAKEVA